MSGKKTRLVDTQDVFNVLSDYYHHSTHVQHLALQEALNKVPTVDAVPLDGSFLKMSRGDYLIYKRHWLYEHFDQEIDIQRSAMKSMGYEPALKDAEPQWIPCGERMPEEPFGCLVTVWDTDPVTMDEFENILPYFVGWDGEQWNDGDGLQCPFEVIAWMPLPEPYEGYKE